MFKKSLLRILSCFSFFVVLAIEAYSQVSIAPSAVFMDPVSRSGMMFVSNPTDNDIEVEVLPIFGYSTFDSLGKSYIEYNDKEMEQKGSLMPYISAFPKKFIMKPKSQQTVRFVLKNVNALPDGIYWARIKTESGKKQEQLDSQNVDGVMVLVNMRMAMVTAVFYKKGENLNTGISVGNFSQRDDSSKVYLMYNLTREGEHPFYGKAKFKITNASGKEVLDKEEEFSLYKTGMKAFDFDKAKLAPGEYKVEMTILAENKNFPKEFLKKMDPIKVNNTFKVE